MNLLNEKNKLASSERSLIDFQLTEDPFCQKCSEIKLCPCWFRVGPCKNRRKLKTTQALSHDLKNYFHWNCTTSITQTRVNSTSLVILYRYQRHLHRNGDGVANCPVDKSSFSAGKCRQSKAVCQLNSIDIERWLHDVYTELERGTKYLYFTLMDARPVYRWFRITVCWLPSSFSLLYAEPFRECQ